MLQQHTTMDSPRSLGLVAGWLLNAESGLYRPGSLVKAGNLTTQAGRALLNQIIQDNDPANGTALDKIAVGDGRTAPTVNDSALVNELVRKTIASFDNTDGVNEPPTFDAQIQLDPAEANANISEVACFFNDGSLTMYGRALFGQGSITGATQANPVVITSASHGLIAGDKIYIENVVGMTEINDTVFTVANETTDTFELQGEDGTGHTAYSSGGTWTKVLVKTASDIAIIVYTMGFSI